MSNRHVSYNPFRQFIFNQFGVSEEFLLEEKGSEFMTSLHAAFDAGRQAEQEAVRERLDAVFEQVRKEVMP